MALDREKEKFQLLKQIVESKAAQPLAARYAVSRLFPNYPDAHGIMEGAGGGDRYRQKADFRLASKDNWTAYFRLSPPSSQWRKDELASLFAMAEPADALEAVERRIVQAPSQHRFNLRRVFVEQLDSSFAIGRLKFSQSWFDALVLFSPIYINAPDELAHTFFSIGFITRLGFVLIRGLEQHGLDVRVELFESAIANSTDISLICDAFRTIAGDVNPGGGRDQFREASLGEHTDRLREVLLEKVRRYAANGLIWEQADPNRVLWFWWGAGREEDILGYTAAEMEKPEGVRALLGLTIHEVKSTAGNYEVVSKSEDKIVDVSRLEARAQEILDRAGSDADRALAKRFLEALGNRKRD